MDDPASSYEDRSIFQPPSPPPLTFEQEEFLRTILLEFNPQLLQRRHSPLTTLEQRERRRLTLDQTPRIIPPTLTGRLSALLTPSTRTSLNPNRRATAISRRDFAHDYRELQVESYYRNLSDTGPSSLSTNPNFQLPDSARQEELEEQLSSQSEPLPSTHTEFKKKLKSLLQKLKSNLLTNLVNAFGTSIWKRRTSDETQARSI